MQERTFRFGTKVETRSLPTKKGSRRFVSVRKIFDSIDLSVQLPDMMRTNHVFMGTYVFQV
jgi:hypothetical protein